MCGGGWVVRWGAADGRGPRPLRAVAEPAGTVTAHQGHCQKSASTCMASRARISTVEGEPAGTVTAGRALRGATTGPGHAAARCPLTIRVRARTQLPPPPPRAPADPAARPTIYSGLRQTGRASRKRLGCVSSCVSPARLHRFNTSISAAIQYKQTASISAASRAPYLQHAGAGGSGSAEHAGASGCPPPHTHTRMGPPARPGCGRGIARARRPVAPVATRRRLGRLPVCGACGGWRGAAEPGVKKWPLGRSPGRRLAAGGGSCDRLSAGPRGPGGPGAGRGLSGSQRPRRRRGVGAGAMSVGAQSR